MSESKRSTSKVVKHSGMKGKSLGSRRTRKAGKFSQPVGLTKTNIRGLGGFSDVERVSLAWSSAIASTEYSTSASAVYALNSVFDPGQSTAATQPANFDLFAAAYNYYRVISTKVEVAAAVDGVETTAGATTTNSSTTIYGALTPTNTTVAISGLENFWTNPRSTFATGTVAKPLRFTRVFDNAAVLGQTEAQYRANESARALVTADPSNLNLVALTIRAADAAITGAFAAKVQVTVKLTYDVEFYRLVLGDVDLATRALLNQAAFKKCKQGWQARIFRAQDPPGLESAPVMMDLRAQRSETKLTETKGESKGDEKFSLGVSRGPSAALEDPDEEALYNAVRSRLLHLSKKPEDTPKKASSVK